MDYVFFLSFPIFGKTTKSIKLSPLYRLPSTVSQLKPHPRGKYIAYVDKDNQRLKILDLKSKKILNISKEYVGGSFFWSPFGFRIFYRSMKKTKDGITSQLAAYDLKAQKSVNIKELSTSTGLLSFDPRDMRMHPIITKGY